MLYIVNVYINNYYEVPIKHNTCDHCLSLGVHFGSYNLEFVCFKSRILQTSLRTKLTYELTLCISAICL